MRLLVLSEGGHVKPRRGRCSQPVAATSTTRKMGDSIIAAILPIVVIPQSSWAAQVAVRETSSAPIVAGWVVGPLRAWSVLVRCRVIERGA